MGCSDNIKFLAATALEFPSLNLLLDLTCCSQGRLGKVKILRHLPGGTVGRWDTATATGKDYYLDSSLCISKSGKEYVKAAYCHPAYLTYMQSTSGETLDSKKHKLESRLLGEISITSDMQVTPPLRQKAKKN